MKTDSIGNEPSFGIRYRNKRLWNKETLKIFENSELLKEIDKKYPSATARLRKYSEGDEYNLWHTMFLEIALTPKKIYKWGLASVNPADPPKQLAEILKSLTLEQVEQKSMSIFKNCSVKNSNFKIFNLIYENFSRIFNRNNI